MSTKNCGWKILIYRFKVSILYKLWLISTLFNKLPGALDRKNCKKIGKKERSWQTFSTKWRLTIIIYILYCNFMCSYKRIIKDLYQNFVFKILVHRRSDHIQEIMHYICHVCWQTNWENCLNQNKITNFFYQSVIYSIRQLTARHFFPFS